jgi:hypothetical protein
MVNDWWALFGDYVLNGALFTVLDFHLRHPHRRTLWPELGQRHNRAVIAVDNLYRNGKCGDILSAADLGSINADMCEIRQSIQDVVDHWKVADQNKSMKMVS